MSAQCTESTQQDNDCHPERAGFSPESRGNAVGVAVDVQSPITDQKSQNELRQRITDLETENTSLRTQLTAQADPQSNNDLGPQSQITDQKSPNRKTLPALVTNLLAKSNIDVNESMDPHALDSALSQLSIDQRIAVKMQMARAGLIA